MAFSYLTIGQEIVPELINLAVNIYEDRLYFTLSQTHSLLHSMQLSQMLLETHLNQPDRLAEFTEEPEPLPPHLENRMTFILKTEHAPPKVLEPKLKTNTSFSIEEIISRKTLGIMSRASVFSIVPKKLADSLKISQVKNQVSYLQSKKNQQQQIEIIPLDKPQLTTEELTELQLTDQLRLKKHICELEDKEDLKKRKLRKEKEKKEMELRNKNRKELEKKVYTYDYNGSVLVKKKNALRYPIYQQIQAAPELSANDSDKSVEVIVIENKRGQSLERNMTNLTAKSNALNQTNQNHNTKRDFSEIYNNNNQRLGFS